MLVLNKWEPWAGNRPLTFLEGFLDTIYSVFIDHPQSCVNVKGEIGHHQKENEVLEKFNMSSNPKDLPKLSNFFLTKLSLKAAQHQEISRHCIAARGVFQFPKSVSQSSWSMYHRQAHCEGHRKDTENNGDGSRCLWVSSFHLLFPLQNALD